MDNKFFPEWKWGVPRDVLIIFSQEIADYLTKIKARPFEEIEVLEGFQGTTSVKKTTQKPSPDPWIQQKLPRYSIYGGMKIPHLHYNGQVFILNEKQWAEFSGIMLNKIKEKLDTTKKVSFDQLMELSSAVGNL